MARSYARIFALLLSLLIVSWLAIASMAAPASATILGTTVDPRLQQLVQADALRLVPVIVEMEHGSSVLGINTQLAQQALALLELNGKGRVPLRLLHGAAGLANADGIRVLSLTPGVAYVHYDAPVYAHADKTSTATAFQQLATAYPRAVSADKAWSIGDTGQSVTVAVLDSGISRDVDLVQPTNRILTEVNFADGLNGSAMDPGGHGTHVAGIIAGNGTGSGGEFVGIAPNANLVDVRVLDSHGRGRTSSVIAGIEWAIAHRQQYNIRVLNLSLGGPPPVNYRLDPLSAAVEMAWIHGLVVVAASGNSGATPDSPGADPYPITVGATDDRGTDGIGDDVLAWFSSYGWPVGSTPKPDVVAPGRRIVSIRAPGSDLDQHLPDRVVTARNGRTYFRLSGTSMSTAVVSGVVAQLLQRHPELSPDRVKAVLKRTAGAFGQDSGQTPSAIAIGSGLVDAYAAVRSKASDLGNRGIRPTDITARAVYPVLYGRPLPWLNRASGRPASGLLKGCLLGATNIAWDNVAWDNVAWDNVAWDNVAWDNIAWDNVAWDNIAWDNIAWDNIAWDNVAWDNIAWDNIAWDSGPLD